MGQAHGLGAANPEQVAIQELTERIGGGDHLLLGELGILYQFEHSAVTGIQPLDQVLAGGDQILDSGFKRIKVDA
jgi:hypothetical protein